MITVTGTKTITNTAAAVFAGTSEMPGEDTKFSLTGLGTETIMVQSKDRALLYEIQEVT